MSYFNYKRIAEGYAKDRPSYHLHVMDMLKEELSIKRNFENGLDVGCGAGLSTIALRNICNHVIGVDESEEMIKVAKSVNDKEDIDFYLCSAEKLELSKDTFEIVTVAGAINWIDEKIFLKQVRNFLKKKGILLIYDNPMSDQMEGVPEFTEWWNGQYLKRFPKPPRKENIWKAEEVKQYGFQILNQVDYCNTVTMNQTEFINYIVTQTNVIAKIEEQGEPLEEVRKWFTDTLEDIFKGEKKTLVCQGYNWYLQLI